MSIEPQQGSLQIMGIGVRTRIWLSYMYVTVAEEIGDGFGLG